jgi:hypothetical protein
LPKQNRDLTNVSFPPVIPSERSEAAVILSERSESRDLHLDHREPA